MFKKFSLSSHGKHNYLISPLMLKLRTIQYMPLNTFSMPHSHQFSDKSSKEWLNRHNKDHFVKKSKILDYRSRATFKLIEINQKFKLLRPGQKILDLGSTPGGWSQIASELSKSDPNKSSIVAVDLIKMDPLPGVLFIQGDFNKLEVQDKILKHNNYEKFDLIISDMCPEFTGTKVTDHVNLIELNKSTLKFTEKVLKRNGILVLKTFEGTLQRKLQDSIDTLFNKINRFKPSSSRSESSELYLVCIGFLENENLKKDAEELLKMSDEELFEKQKNEALRVYTLSKYRKTTLLADLDKLREEIKNKFKHDPESIKIDPKEEEAIKKQIEEEELQLHLELYGRAYLPIKEDNIFDFTENQLKERHKIDEKLKDMLRQDNIDVDEYKEYFTADLNEKHFKEMSEEKMKELKFIEQRAYELSKKISEEEARDMFRQDNNENEILSKYKRWEEIIKAEKKQQEEEYKSFVTEESSQDRAVHITSKEDDTFLKVIQRNKKNIDKSSKKRTDSLPETDVFWSKKQKQPKE